MKLQVRAEALRLRIDESELGILLAGESLSLQLDLRGRMLLNVALRLDNRFAFDAKASRWNVRLDRALVAAYAGKLPCRDGLRFPIADGVDLDFEVDVRDSLRTRGPRARNGSDIAPDAPGKIQSRRDLDPDQRSDDPA